jgi:hypothetical protein
MRGSPAVLPLATALLLGGCVRHSPLPRQMETAFGPVRLGVPWNPVDLAGVGLGDTIVGLPAGAIQGGGRVTVYRAADGTVRRVWRDYPQSVDFVRLSGDLRRQYGLPAVHERSADPEAPERIVWEDPRTRLELIRDPRRSVATVYGLLVDRLPDRAD